MVISQMTKRTMPGRYNSWVLIYDLNLGTWNTRKQLWTRAEHLKEYAYVGFCGQLYAFREQEVMKYDAGLNVWT